MRKFDTKVQYLKYKVLREVARQAWNDTLLDNVMSIPRELAPRNAETIYCCVYKERAILSERVRMAMGGNKQNPNVIEVIDIACDECPMGGYEVTNSCRGCLARRCEDACPKGAITFHNHVAHIDKAKCVDCGACARVCPYSAIVDRKRPCENACKIKAITMNENKAAAIDNNTCISCGACALFTPLTIEKNTLMKEFPFSILCAGLLVVMGYLGMSLGRVDGVILLVIFAVYLFWMIQSAKKARTAGDKLEAEEEALAEEEIKILPMWKCIVFIIGGMIAIKFGGDFVVDGASAIAAGFGLSQTLIGLTIVALGTSLPELVTSIVAAKKDEVDMALGNVIGSNIFNILLILGVAAAISPVTFLMENIIDIIILIIMSAVVWGFAWTSKKVNRKEGIIMLLMYAVYMVYICMR